MPRKAVTSREDMIEGAFRNARTRRAGNRDHIIRAFRCQRCCFHTLQVHGQMRREGQRGNVSENGGKDHL